MRGVLAAIIRKLRTAEGQYVGVSSSNTRPTTVTRGRRLVRARATVTTSATSISLASRCIVFRTSCPPAREPRWSVRADLEIATLPPKGPPPEPQHAPAHEMHRFAVHEYIARLRNQPRAMSAACISSAPSCGLGHLLQPPLDKYQCTNICVMTLHLRARFGDRELTANEVDINPRPGECHGGI